MLQFRCFNALTFCRSMLAINILARHVYQPCVYILLSQELVAQILSLPASSHNQDSRPFWIRLLGERNTIEHAYVIFDAFVFTGRTYCNATWDGWGCWNYTVVCVYRSHLLQRHLGRMGMLELHSRLCLQVAPTATPPGTDGDVGTTQSFVFTGRTYCNATWDGWGCWNYTVVCVYRSHLLQRHLGRMGMLELHGRWKPSLLQLSRIYQWLRSEM